MSVYIEQDCTIEHEGQTYMAGGAVVTPERIVAYPDENGILQDYHGNEIGMWRSVASWRVNSFIGERMHQIEATVDGVTYTGRGFGRGMVYKGRRKVLLGAREPNDTSSRKERGEAPSEDHG